MVSDMLVFAPDVSVAKNHQVLYPESDACFSPFRYALVSAYFYELRQIQNVLAVQNGIDGMFSHHILNFSSGKIELRSKCASVFFG